MSSNPGREITDDEWVAAVTMGCGDACPNVAARVQMPPEQFREVRDLIGRKVKELLGRL